MFSREVAMVPEIQICAGILPARGSNHPAFVEMLFLWGEAIEDDSRFRRVILPSGFTFVTVDACRFEIRDLEGNVRAVITSPQDGLKIPSISPTKRYSVGAETVGVQHRGVAYDRGSAVYRTKPFQAQQDAVTTARKWLDENKPRWDSYVSAVNFE
jgi:hypothetical protein